jgi:hypothetical protein
MAFEVQEAGERIGDFTLTLSDQGSTVFTDMETGVENEFVHMGTGATTLPTGLVFDELRLDYTMTSSSAVDMDNNPTGQPVGSTITGILPIFGPPELSAVSLGIAFGPVSVPEPQSLALLFVGLGAVGVAARRRRRAA